MMHKYPLADVTRALFALLWWGLWAPMSAAQRFRRVLDRRVPRVFDHEALTMIELELHGHLMSLSPEEQRRLTYELFEATFPTEIPVSTVVVERLCRDENELWHELLGMVAREGYGRPAEARAWATRVCPERTAERAKLELCELLMSRDVDKLRFVLGIVPPGEVPARPGSPAVNRIVADTAAAEASAAQKPSANAADLQTMDEALAPHGLAVDRGYYLANGGIVTTERR
jgi:hypothetical protein